MPSFLFAYSTIYYYNDLLDYDTDKKRSYMPSDKLLYYGDASPYDYVHLLAWVPVVGLSAAFLYSQLLGVVSALAILVNHLRTLLIHLSQGLQFQSLERTLSPMHYLTRFTSSAQNP